MIWGLRGHADKSKLSIFKYSINFWQQNNYNWSLFLIGIAPVSKHDDDAIEGVDYWSF